jgi:peptidoglycan/LPS O-acetylase OafA/YrhL
VLGHRPALDGIRGLAILLVLLSHAQLGPFYGGGPVGVTLFFVLSGFLITSLLLTELRSTGTIGLWAFYRRRIRRLLPALVVLLAVVTTVEVVAGRSPWGDAASALFYVANVDLILTGDVGLLTHTWSLSVEEHFYALWPLAVMALLPWLGTRRFVILVVVGIIASFALRVALMASGAPDVRLAYGTDVRAEALLLGCLLAFAWRSGRTMPHPLVAAVLLVVLSLSVQPDAAGLTIGLLASGLAAMWLVSASLDGSRLLEWSPLRRLGRISYGVYLWHFPLMFGATGVLLDSPFGGVLLIAASIAIAELSFRLVESRFLAPPQILEGGDTRGRRAAASVRHGHAHVRRGHGVSLGAEPEVAPRHTIR